MVFLIVGQVSAYTPEQQTILDGMNLRCQLCIAHEKAIQGQNLTEYNNLVDTYNAWIRQHFDEGVDALLMSKMATTNLPKRQIVVEAPYSAQRTYLTKKPFNATSDLGKFGKQQVFRESKPGESEQVEATTADRILKDFLAS